MVEWQSSGAVNGETIGQWDNQTGRKRTGNAVTLIMEVQVSRPDVGRCVS